MSSEVATVLWMTSLLKSEAGSLNLRRESPSGPGTVILTVISFGSEPGSVEDAMLQDVQELE